MWFKQIFLVILGVLADPLQIDFKFLVKAFLSALMRSSYQPFEICRYPGQEGDCKMGLV